MYNQFKSVLKIYTKTGDKGDTSLLGGKRVSKDCLEVQVIGEVDELNAALGVAVSCLLSFRPSEQSERAEESLKPEVKGSLDSAKAPLEMTTLIDFLQIIQHDLFKVGAEIAGLQMSKYPSPRPSANRGGIEGGVLLSTRVEEMEKMIDKFWNELPELKNFILPGGGVAGAQLHLARAVCRRVERGLVIFGRTTALRPELYMYFNRLSDFLFAAARWVNLKEGEEEIKV